jgi:hypothetical protein
MCSVYSCAAWLDLETLLIFVAIRHFPIRHLFSRHSSIRHFSIRCCSGRGKGAILSPQHLLSNYIEAKSFLLLKPQSILQ